MFASQAEALAKQLKDFQNEKERIRTVLGQIGGVAAGKNDRVITIVFFLAISGLFVLDVLRHIIGLDIPLPPLFSIQLGILLVSIKMIWMLHAQTRIAHFQFWMLHSIEFRINDLARRLRNTEEPSGNNDEHSGEEPVGPGTGRQQ